MKKVYTVLFSVSFSLMCLGVNAQSFNNPNVACSPTDSNIGFEQGTLSGWNAYYAKNNSDTGSYIITSITGGISGAVTSAANDPFSNLGTGNDCQVSIMNGGNDPIVPSIPRVSSFGGNYSVRLGDSTNPNNGVAILSQQFTVTSANTAFQYQYAVLLVDPGHAPREQPFFSVVFFDQNGDTIPSPLKLVAAYHAKQNGFDSSIYYNSLYINYKKWTSVTVPLNLYIGQCVTVQFEVADCSESLHWGYAYIDASVSPLGVNEIQNNSLFSVYPVPATNKLNITLPNNNFTPKQVTVYDVTGREVLTENINMQQNKTVLDVSKLDNGAYVLMLTDNNIRRQTRFIIAK